MPEKTTKTTKETKKTKETKETKEKSKKGLILGLICGAVVLIAAVIAIIVFACGYHKKTETYTIKNEARGSELTFEFAGEELGYEFKEKYNGAEFYNPGDKSRITITLHDAYYPNLIKEEDAFWGDAYRDYEKGNFAGYEGYKIVHEASLATDIEMALVLDVYDPSQNRIDGVDIDIDQSPMQPREATFNTREFFESADFQHLLKTMKLTVGEDIEE